MVVMDAQCGNTGNEADRGNHKQPTIEAAREVLDEAMTNGPTKPENIGERVDIRDAGGPRPYRSGTQ
jgi:hypothetical protein